jgi:hypothetical protein
VSTVHAGTIIVRCDRRIRIRHRVEMKTVRGRFARAERRTNSVTSSNLGD